MSFRAGYRITQLQFQLVAFILSIHGLGTRGDGEAERGIRGENSQAPEMSDFRPPPTPARPSAHPPASRARPRDTLCETTKGGWEHNTEHNAFFQKKKGVYYFKEKSIAFRVAFR